MAEPTPLEELGAAINKFFRDTEGIEPHAFLTGWVIAASTARVQADDDTALPMVTGAQYALGPETSLTNAAGLTRFLDVVLERATWNMLREADETDD
jgi:hypothetical protein